MKYKSCKDCKHKRNSWIIWPIIPMGSKFWKCVAPEGKEFDPVSGKSSMRFKYCHTHRTGSYVHYDVPLCCGVMGKFFEPKEKK